MKKRMIKKYGNSLAVKLEIADLKDNDLTEGDELDLEDALKKGKVEQ